MAVWIARSANLLGLDARHLDNKWEFIMNTDALEDDASEPNVGRCVQIQATRIDAAGDRTRRLRLSEW
jgi:hypothetical protein